MRDTKKIRNILIGHESLLKAQCCAPAFAVRRAQDHPQREDPKRDREASNKIKL